MKPISKKAAFFKNILMTIKLHFLLYVRLYLFIGMCFQNQLSNNMVQLQTLIMSSIISRS